MHNAIQQQKKLLREQITAIKKTHTKDELLNCSFQIMSSLEKLPFFKQAKHVFIYNSLNDEVQTIDFINRWCKEKNFYLPVIKGDDLVFRKYVPEGQFNKAVFGILEPLGEDFTDYANVDIIIVPGMAFDRNRNRMGRGKGFYDRFLPSVIAALKIGVCYDFQLYDTIPTEEYDIKMDYIVSEKGIII